MGIAGSIFTVDTHVHGQRHAFKFKEKGLKPDYATLAAGMSTAEVYDNSDRMLYHMDRYQVDVCVLLPAFAMTNEINLEIVKKHPDRFVAMCSAMETHHKSERGEAEWTLEAAAKEVEQLLETGMFVGIGEGTPVSRHPNRKELSWEERFDQICVFMELARKYKVVAEFHTGFPSGYGGSKNSARIQGHYQIDRANPLLCHQVANAYPDVPIIMCHAGIEGSGYYTRYYEDCLNVAASHHNVYLETGMWWAELYEKALKDPSIGAERLVWGTDWGASSTPQMWMPGCQPESFCSQNINLGPPSHQVDIWGWSLRELGKLNIPQDDLNLILGGNAVRLMGIKTPCSRLFREPYNKFETWAKAPQKRDVKK